MAETPDGSSSPDDAASAPLRRSWPPVAFPPRYRAPGFLGRAISVVDAFVEWAWRSRLVYAVLLLAAVFSAWWGYTDFYGSQFGRVPSYTWPFIADSPNAVLLWVLASFILKARLDGTPGPVGHALTFLVHVAIVWNVKVGVWTDFVLLYHYDHYFTGGPARIALQWTLIASHAGMIGYALLLFRKAFPLRTAGYLALMALALLFDFVDYGYAHLFLDDAVSLWPNGVPANKIDDVALVTVLLSVATTTLLATGMRLRGPPVDR